MPLKKYFTEEEKLLAQDESKRRYRLAHKNRCAVANKNWREKNKEKIKAQQDEYYRLNSEEILKRNRLGSRQRRLTDPQTYKLHCVKSRAKRLGLEFNLEREDIIIPEICPILGIKIHPAHEGRAYNDSWALDRIDNSKGYVKGNIRVISHRANVYKSNMDIATVEKLLAYMKGEI